jgi:hypothetical protein
MIRALTTLVGLAGAAALLLLVIDTGAAEGGDLWQRAALIAGAGLVAGAFYQLGGIRRPGVRVNLPLFIGAFVPWTLLTLAICAQRAGTPVWMTDLAHDVLPDSALVRWSASFPILAFMDGMLLSFALVEPLVQEKLHAVRVTDEGAAPLRPEVAEPAAEPEAETEIQREPAHSVH